MAFNRKITLFNYSQAYGTQPKSKIDVRTGVWCKFDLVGSTVALNPQSISIKLTNQVEMWAKSYKQEGYATIDGIDYKVQNAVKTGNDLTIKLLLSRG